MTVKQLKKELDKFADDMVVKIFDTNIGFGKVFEISGVDVDSDSNEVHIETVEEN